jgi:hypothetical protein
MSWRIAPQLPADARIVLHAVHPARDAFQAVPRPGRNSNPTEDPTEIKQATMHQLMEIILRCGLRWVPGRVGIFQVEASDPQCGFLLNLALAEARLATPTPWLRKALRGQREDPPGR